MLKVFCCYTEAHKPLLKNYFLPSLPNDVHLTAIPLDIAGAGDFLSPEFIRCIRRKVNLILDSLVRFDGTIIVWSDIDIVFFKSFAREIEAFMETRGLDIAFQKEGFGQWDKEVNTGFIAMRCNDRVRAFYRNVLEALENNPDKNEQPVINDLLQAVEDLKWEMLPVEFTAKSHGWPPTGEMTLYHANVTGGENGVGRKIEQFESLYKRCGKKPRRVCVVSPEVIGPRRNSGIGTHTFHLLKMLAKQPDVSVTLLMSSEILVEREGGWVSWFRQHLDVEFVHLEPLPHLYQLVGWFNHWFNLRSMQVYNYLRNENFEIVHFQDLNADGFICNQARKTGLAFQKAVFTTMINGPAKWAREGMKQFAGNEVYESMLNFMESYCLGESDLVLAPSKYAFEYAEKEAGWQLCPQRRICPYMLDLPDEADVHEIQEPAIVFFGRLETRKGIHLFLSALERLHREDCRDIPRKVVFIGNHSDTPSGRSEEVIPQFFHKNLPGWEYFIINDLDQPDCIDLLKQHRQSVVVLPSISETLGYVAIESLELGLNVIGSDTGAFPEVFADKERMFACHPRAIAAKIKDAFLGKLPPARSLYDRDCANKAWKDVHAECMQILQSKLEQLPAQLPPQPLVSVCVPYFNYGGFIRQQVESLCRQTYKNFELILINDGSTQPESIQEFNSLKEEYSGDKRCKFLDQENMGLSPTRNRAAALARGEYLVFCDADNVSKPAMLETFVRAISVSGADCITCHFDKFRLEADGRRTQLDYYTPVGACLEAGPYVDPFGDANCIIRRDVFLGLGGFRHVPFTASEDWEFFAELCLSGHTLEVVPADLFEYREHPASNMRTTNFYDTRMRTIEPYLKRMTGWQRDFLVASVGAWEVKNWQQGEIRREVESLKDTIRQETALNEEKRRELDEANALIASLNEEQAILHAEIRKGQATADALAVSLDGEKEKVREMESLLQSLKNSLLKRLFFRK